MNYKVKNIGLAGQGLKNLTWASKEMPVLKSIEKDFKKKKPLKGVKLGVCLHITKETGVLLLMLRDAGASLSVCASNPLTTQDDIAAALAKSGINIFASRGMSTKDYWKYANIVLESKPQILIDDAADLIYTVHTKKRELLPGIYGGMEQTTTGVTRLRAMAKQGVLQFPVVAVNDSRTKHLFDNYYGTGQSTVDGIIRATNVMLAGKNVVVAGYGYCGAGIAKVLRGLGSHVYITEVDPVRALAAVMDGFNVLPMAKAATLGDVFVTVTGNIDVITLKHMEKMKDGAIVCNAGHFNVEVAVTELGKHSKATEVRNNMTEHKLKNGRVVYVLSEGRLVNLSAAEGHPSAVMDTSFANHALGSVYLFLNRGKLPNDVLIIPEEMDSKIASLKLKAIGVNYDLLTLAQKSYISGWQQGT